MSEACFGLAWLGLCAYDPAAPSSIYFSLGDVVAALAFTLAVQQFLKPIYRFRLSARYLNVAQLYGLIFGAVGAAIIAAIVPHMNVLHGGPWGYAIVWELVATLLFVGAYGAVVVAVVLPIRVGPRRIDDFARGAARLLSSASESDHVDLLADLSRSLPVLVREARFVENEHGDQWSAFFDFIHRRRIEQASFAHSFLRIIADPNFCKSLVSKAPWDVAEMLGELGHEKVHARTAEIFIQELAQQAILQDEGMMAREVDFHGFGSAPLLSESLFSDSFIVERYDPLQTFSTPALVTGAVLERFNSAAKRCYETLIEDRHTEHAQVAFSIRRVYESAFVQARRIQDSGQRDLSFSMAMHDAVREAMRLANKLQASRRPEAYDYLFLTRLDEHRYDVLQSLVDIVYEAVASVSNSFKGVEDPFWSTALDVFHDGFNSIGDEPNGMTPFQQRLAIKLLDTLHDNMRGYYPAVARVLLLGVGPYKRKALQANRTAFNILRDAIYLELRGLPKLVTDHPEKLEHYLPPSVQYDTSTKELTWTYLSGSTDKTRVISPRIAKFSLIGAALRRQLTDAERERATKSY